MATHDGDGPRSGSGDAVIGGPPPDFGTPDCTLPLPRPPEDPPPEDNEIQIALERARLIAEDLRQVLEPAQQMMREGAWVSRSADQFSLELEENARLCGMAGERGVEAIEERAQRPPGDGLETVPLYPQGL